MLSCDGILDANIVEGSYTSARLVRLAEAMIIPAMGTYPEPK
jgi:hypothetical protein